MRLLDPSSNLKAVTVEGVSPNENTPAKAAGLLKVDTAEYFGGEHFGAASTVIFHQLKYAPINTDAPWKAGEVAETFGAFAKLFEGCCADHGEANTVAKAKFQFVTNRPIADGFVKALQAARLGRARLPGQDNRALTSLRKAADMLSADRFRLFAQLFEFDAGLALRTAQEWEALREVSRYLPDRDAVAPLLLENLIRSKALVTGDRAPIRMHDILQALHVSSEKDLLPAQQAKGFVLPSDLVPRIQEQDIAARISATEGLPIIIEAPGGVGKSVLALRLPSLMQAGSEAVVFDGFADGRYREPNQPRHHHDRGLVQIANELAFRGLCDLLLPTQADSGRYIDAFLHRLRQAAETVRSRSPDALVLVVLDAADNSQMAADLQGGGGVAFTRDLMRVTVPPGCRIVALARTERVVSHLKPGPQIDRIPLDPFTWQETAAFLRSGYPQTDDPSVTEFHRLTSGNPRVQANAIDGQASVAHILRDLGPNPLAINDMISAQLKRAVDRIRDEAASPDQIDTLCIGLAALPPLVPISVLASAAEIPESLVQSFISDLGRPLMELDGAVHFRDEPVDTWFRDTYAQKDHYARLIDALAPRIAEPYVAFALPELMWQAGKIDDLMDLAAGERGLPEDDPVTRRRIVLRRVHFALKGAVKEGRAVDMVKLAMRAGEEASGDERQVQILLDNADLVATLWGVTRAQEIVFRHQGGTWLGAGYAIAAAILAGDAASHGEARSMLRCAEDWLTQWAGLSLEERNEAPIRHEEIANMAYSHLRLHGPAEMVRELGRWSPKEISFQAGRLVVRRLVDAGDFDIIDAVAVAGKDDAYLSLGIVDELARIGRVPPAIGLRGALKTFSAKSENKESWRANPIDDACLSLAETASQCGLPKTSILALLRRHEQPIPDWIGHGDNSKRDAALRSRCLRAALGGTDLGLEDVTPPGISKKVAENKYSRDQEVDRFQTVIGALLPWYKLRASVIVGSLAPALVGESISVARKTMNKDYRWGNDEGWIQGKIAQLWLESLIRSEGDVSAEIDALRQWRSEREKPLWPSTLTEMARVAARHPSGKEAAYDFAASAKAAHQSAHDDATGLAKGYVDLARAVLPLGRDEAVVYFDEALQVVGRFGNEVFQRWSAVTAIADRAGDNGGCRPALAYRLARAAETIAGHVGENFPWDKAICAVARLCPTSSMAILSRWRDRGQGWFEHQLPELVPFLVEHGHLPPAMAAPLFALADSHWDLPEFLGVVLEKEPNPDSRRKILDFFVHHLQVEGWWPQAAKMRDVAYRFFMSDFRLDAMAGMADRPPEAERDDDDEDTALRRQLERTEEPPAWDNIIGGRKYITAHDVDAAYAAAPRGFDVNAEVFRRMREHVPTGQEVRHLAALASSELYISTAISALDAAAQAWKNRAAVGRALTRVVTDLIKTRVVSLLDNWPILDKNLTQLAQLSGCSRPVLAGALLEGAADAVEGIAGQSLFIMAQEAAASLTPAEGTEALDYALQRIEQILGDDDGDGPWLPELAPPDTITKTLAGFLYAALAAPNAEFRWRAMHTIRRLGLLDQAEVLSELVGLSRQDRLPAFTDERLPFYYLHARLYLLMALARLARERPALIRPHASAVAHYALRDLPHVLMRQFAADAALTIEAAFPGTYSPEDAKTLRSVNASHRRVVSAPNNHRRRFKWGGRKDRRFLFHHDLEEYWFESLAELFGADTSAVTDRVEHWICERWGKASSSWKDDPRAVRRLYSDQGRSLRKSDYPKEDEYHFYLAYHGMFCAAGDLLASQPLVTTRYGDTWDKWVHGHSLTCRDGRWLSDHRDPVPLRPSSIEQEPDAEEWPWLILPGHFDQLLGLDDPTKRLVVWGHWSESNGRSNDDPRLRRESSHILSALVSQQTAMALLRTLQTSDHPSEYGIPSAGAWGREHEIHSQRFKMSGWMADSDISAGLDRFDPFGGMSYPRPGPASAISRLMNLTRSDDGRVWTAADGQPVMWSETWCKGKGERQPGALGDALSIDFAFLLELLRRTSRSLIMEVKIDRTQGKEEYGDQTPPYFRITLITSDGSVRTLRGCRRLGGDALQGIGAQP